MNQSQARWGGDAFSCGHLLGTLHGADLRGVLLDGPGGGTMIVIILRTPAEVQLAQIVALKRKR